MPSNWADEKAVELTEHGQMGACVLTSDKRLLIAAALREAAKHGAVWALQEAAKRRLEDAQSMCDRGVDERYEPKDMRYEAEMDKLMANDIESGRVEVRL